MRGRRAVTGSRVRSRAGGKSGQSRLCRRGSSPSRDESRISRSFRDRHASRRLFHVPRPAWRRQQLEDCREGDNLPLVRTAMTAPTRFYQQTEMLTPEPAADFVVPCDHRTARPHRHAARHLRRAGERGRSAGRTHHHEHRLPHVPGVGRGHGQEGRRRRAATYARADRLRPVHPRLSLLTVRLRMARQRRSLHLSRP